MSFFINIFEAVSGGSGSNIVSPATNSSLFADIRFTLIFIIILLVCIVFDFLCILYTCRFAKKIGKSKFLWGLLVFLFGPIVSICLILDYLYYDNSASALKNNFSNSDKTS